MKKFVVCLIILFAQLSAWAQFSPADSAFMLNIYYYPLYIDSTQMPGNWFHTPEPSSFYNHYLQIDTAFKFTTTDIDSIDYVTITGNLQYDTAINPLFNTYPTLMNQTNPMMRLPFSLNNKTGFAHTYFYPSLNSSFCKTGILLVPGSGGNQSFELVRGTGYHNLLCSIRSNCQNYGDVFTLIKPNEEARSYHWNNQKLGPWIFWYCTSANTYYGTNYLIELVSMIKYMKTKYDKVLLMGLSEGGYASLLSTIYIKPDAALIAGGYSINFDTCTEEKDYLRMRFDTLVDHYDRVKIKNMISNSNTQYLFTWGNNDPVPTLDPEHDFHYTEQYFNGLTNCSYFYDFNDHTFPPCNAIDTFVQRVLAIPQAHFFITDSTSQPDTLFTQVRFCNSGSYQFDLYKDTTFIQNYSFTGDSLNIALTDSGYYFIKNISNSSQVLGTCFDTIYCNKYPTLGPLSTSLSDTSLQVFIRNPFQEKLELQIPNKGNEALQVKIITINGITMYYSLLPQSKLEIPTSQWPIGTYFILLQGRNLNYKKMLVKY